MIRLAGAALAVLVLVSAAPAAELERCRTSIAGEVLDFAYDPDRPALKDSLSLRERLIGAGRNVSEARTGRRPGSRVCTLRDGTAGVPTILLSVEG